MIAAVVPVKALAASKSRLFPHLPRSAVADLSMAMMADVLEALLQVEALARVVVVTPDEDVARAAITAGAEALLRPDPGLNEAIEAASAEVAADAGDGVLVVLGDVAAIDPTDLAALVAALPGEGVALAPSSDGGTSALLRVPWDAIPACFGVDSAKRHRDAAERAGVEYHEVALASLALDVDVVEDALELLRSTGGARHTRSVLEALRPGEPS